jgi:predicted membrane protein
MWSEEKQRRFQARMERRRQRHAQRGPQHAAFGLVLVIVGAVFLLTNLGYIDPFEVQRNWPVLLVLFGLGGALTSVGPRRVWGGLLAVAGLTLLARNYGYIHAPIWQLFWPLILIFFGVSMLWRTLRPHAYGPGGAGLPPGSTGNPNVLHEVNVFGGVERRVDSQEFEGGQVVSVFGGVEIDMRGAATKRDEIHIELNSVFGGVDLRVPDSWDVTVQGAGIFGGYEDKTMPRRTPESGKRPHLIITGSAVFGGVTVS